MIKDPTTQVALGTVPVLVILNQINAVVASVAGIAAALFLISRIYNAWLDSRVKKLDEKIKKAELEKLTRELEASAK